MQFPSRSTPPRSVYGGSLAPVLIVVAALVLSTAIFFLFTKKKIQAQNDAIAEKAAATASAAKADAPAVPATQPPPPKPPKPAPPAFAFARPLDLGRQLVRSLTTGDFATAGKLAAASDAGQSDSAAKLFEKLAAMGYKPAAEDQVELLGLVENRTRITLPFLMPGSQESVRVQLDLERDDKMGWKVAKATLPKAMSGAIAAMPATLPAAPAPGKPGTPAPPSAAPPTAATSMKPLFTVEDGTDALTFASDFVRHLLKHDFTAARAFVDDAKVPVERLLGLCIVFEEGQYSLNPAKPLIVTIANPEVSWVIAQVQSESLQQNTEFGVELKRADIAQPWKIVGLNLSDILGSFAKSASKLGVPYTPIVKNPKGGESLALYFEYDRAELHPRALKQLEVISALMKADPSKKLRIAGHTDEKGEDDYNIRLSHGRAEAVKKQLAVLGVPAGQVETSGLGKAQPLSPNKKSDGTDDPEGRSHNRRAEIYLDF
ncbi:OmpA family protein [Prosthecobacter sp.]|uniref:OmpA family protein n=1 Tax=Prosthecobacter sp. TaxID=1965333 RepID=UPI002487BA69|nr:OmpA family protein [Prosthecobacter sp.]MDI1314478.1 OmpA family protein [Prosthecobacter sp.]